MTQNQEKKQIIEIDPQEMQLLQLSGIDFRITSDTFREIKDKMENSNREQKCIYIKRINGNFIIDKNKIKIKNILDEFKADQTQIKRGLVNWKIHQKKISRLKHRQKDGKYGKSMSYFGHSEDVQHNCN